MTNGERVRLAWDRSGLVAYATLAVLLSAGAGLCAGLWITKNDIIGMTQSHREERQADMSAHRAEIGYLRERLVESKQIIARQSDQLARAGIASSDAAAKASETAAEAIKQTASEPKQ